MTTLAKNGIKARIFHKDPSKRLIITPIIDADEQIGEGTIDIRLGTRFILFKGRKITTLDPTEDNMGEKIREFQERVYVPFGKQLILHPNQFILGGSLEFFRFPTDLLGLVVGRSSWGRLGLIIEASPIIHPSFMGVLTFEFSNLSTAPIALRPGFRIAQIAIQTVEAGEYGDIVEIVRRSRYNLSTKPEFSKIHLDSEIKKLKIIE